MTDQPINSQSDEERELHRAEAAYTRLVESKLTANLHRQRALCNQLARGVEGVKEHRYTINDVLDAISPADITAFEGTYHFHLPTGQARVNFTVEHLELLASNVRLIYENNYATHEKELRVDDKEVRQAFMEIGAARNMLEHVQTRIGATPALAPAPKKVPMPEERAKTFAQLEEQVNEFAERVRKANDPSERKR